MYFRNTHPELIDSRNKRVRVTLTPRHVLLLEPSSSQEMVTVLLLLKKLPTFKDTKVRKMGFSTPTCIIYVLQLQIGYVPLYQVNYCHKFVKQNSLVTTLLGQTLLVVGVFATFKKTIKHKN